jgi:hypothetical protein
MYISLQVKQQRLNKADRQSKQRNVLTSKIYNDGSVNVFFFNPEGDGNCQFQAFAFHLSLFGINVSASDMRKKAVDHLYKHDDFYKEFVEISFEKYIVAMANNGTWLLLDFTIVSF